MIETHDAISKKSLFLRNVRLAFPLLLSVPFSSLPLNLMASLFDATPVETVALEAGLKKEITVVGSGASPKTGDEVHAHYTGKLTATGAVFDSSRTRGKAFTFRIGIGQVISGWDVGIASMKVGERAVLTCDPAHGYGARGAGGAIPPNAELAFDVELLSVGAPPAGSESSCAVA